MTQTTKHNLAEYLKVNEAAAYLGVSTWTLRNWDKSGKLKPMRHPMNGYRIYKQEDLDAILQKGDLQIRGILSPHPKPVANWTGLAAPKISDEPHAFLAAIVESSNDAIISKTLDGQILSWNRSAEELFGYKADEIIGKPIATIIPPDRHDEERMILERLSRGEQIGHFETIRHTKDGRLVNLSLTISPVRDRNGNIIGASKVARDITERKSDERRLQEALEKAQAATNAKSEFLANMSHELRTPLNAVIGIANLLQHPGMTAEKQKEFLKTLHLSAQQLLQLINDLLDISKLESQLMKLERIPFSPEDIANEVFEIHNITAKEKHIYLDFPENRTPAIEVMGDPLRFKQILNNLISNAIKFTEKGGVTMEISHQALQNQPHHITYCVKVTDTGVGIQSEKLGGIFAKFTQADMSTTRKYGGTGLGLAITKTLVDLMGGTITVESHIGKGSSFTVTIPFARHQNGSSFHEEIENIPANFSEISVIKKHVLLVEDYQANILVATTMLNILGYSYDIAGTGKDALEKIKKQKYDLILMDIQMPEMDGLTATKKLREWENAQNLPPLPVIGMTAHALIGDKERCIEAGMNDYISKPFQQKELEQKLEIIKK